MYCCSPAKQFLLAHRVTEKLAKRQVWCADSKLNKSKGLPEALVCHSLLPDLNQTSWLNTALLQAVTASVNTMTCGGIRNYIGTDRHDEPKALVIACYIREVINTDLCQKGINELSDNNFCNSSSIKSKETTVLYKSIKNNHFQLKLSRTAIIMGKSPHQKGQISSAQFQKWHLEL